MAICSSGTTKATTGARDVGRLTWPLRGMACVGTCAARQQRRAVWQFVAAYPLLLAAGAALRWGQTPDDAPATRHTERAGRRVRRHTATHGRYTRWPWLTSPMMATANAP